MVLPEGSALQEQPPGITSQTPHRKAWCMLTLQLGTSLLPLTFKAGGQNLDFAGIKELFTTYFAVVKQTSESMLNSLKVSWLSSVLCTCISLALYRPHCLNVRCADLKHSVPWFIRLSMMAEGYSHLSIMGIQAFAKKPKAYKWKPTEGEGSDDSPGPFFQVKRRLLCLPAPLLAMIRV